MPAPLRPFRYELMRKMLHLLALALPAGIYALDKPLALFVLIPLSAIAAGADALRAKSEGFARFVARAFGRLMRPDEIPPPGGRVVLNGATCILISAALLTLLFPVDLAAPGLASFVLADAAAAIAGMRFGRTPWPGTHRTVQGSIAFACAAWAMLASFGHISAGAAALAAVAGAAVEAANLPLDDNIRTPLAMTAILWALGQGAAGGGL